MKYIRTEDGVYLVDEERETYFIKLSKNGFENYVSREKVIKTADSIEELCDGLVIAYKDCCEKRTYLYSGTIQKFKESRPNYKNKFFTYYGAIWVDGKGLIYVAKMNENGELELI